MKAITTEKTILTENSELLASYFKSINKYPVYSSSEQIELAKKCKAGDEKARQQLINSNLRFVVTCAKKYVSNGVSLMDLIQAGNLGLIQSLKNYDPDTGYHFITFAVWYIRREIIKAIYNNGGTVRFPISYVSKITKVKKAYDEFTAKNQRSPNEEELLELTNITQKQYSSTLETKAHCQSIDAPISEDGKTTIENFLTEEQHPFTDPFTKDSISKALQVLTPRERLVISEYYGVDGIEEKNIREIAYQLQLSEERIRQIRKMAIKKLERRCGNVLKSLL